MLKPPFSPLFDQVEERLEEGDVVILATGDPLFYGIAEMVVKRFGHSMVRVVPNISYVQLAFARMGVSWQNAGFFSVHGRGLRGLLRAFTLAERYLFLFTDPENDPARIASHLLDRQVEDVRVWVFSDLEGPGEKVAYFSPGEAACLHFAQPNCVVLEKTRQVRPHPFIPDSNFMTVRGLLTKAPLRAMVLSLLSTDPGQVAWDVGAGSGAVSISLSPLVETVYAVERHEGHLGLLMQNRNTHGAWNVLPVKGEAPGVLKELPNPRSVFVGAGGELLLDILRTCWDRLEPKGVLVATVVTLKGRKSLLEWGKGEVFSLQLSRGELEASPGMMEPARPIWILRAYKP